MTTPWWWPDRAARPDLAPWAEAAALSLAGGLIVGGLALGCAAAARSDRVRLAVWRVALVLLAVLPVAELAGWTGRLTDWLRPAVAEHERGPEAGGHAHPDRPGVPAPPGHGRHPGRQVGRGRPPQPAAQPDE